MTRVAAIDCGTNSIRLLVTDIDAGVQTDRDRRMRIVRLGQDVDRTRRFADAALARTLSACEEYAVVCADLGVERLRFCATSAARDVTNGDAFAAGVMERLGVEPEVITGAAEAEMSFTGALRDLPDHGDALVLDIGGGSTEVIRGSGSEVETARSVDIGSVRLTERHLRTDPPTESQIAAARVDVNAELDGLDVDLAGLDTVVGVAGTVTTVAAHVLGLPAYQPEQIHQARLAIADVRTSCAGLIGATVERRKSMPFMHPGRADVIGGGALILAAVLERLDVVELVVSEHDILDGIAWSLVGP